MQRVMRLDLWGWDQALGCCDGIGSLVVGLGSDPRLWGWDRIPRCGFGIGSQVVGLGSDPVFWITFCSQEYMQPLRKKFRSVMGTWRRRSSSSRLSSKVQTTTVGAVKAISSSTGSTGNTSKKSSRNECVSPDSADTPNGIRKNRTIILNNTNHKP